jgi:hypothetical protein
MSKYSLGNMGGASVDCQANPFRILKDSGGGHVTMRCPVGYLNVDARSYSTGLPIFTAGIVRASSEFKNQCVPNADD